MLVKTITPFPQKRCIGKMTTVLLNLEETGSSGRRLVLKTCVGGTKIALYHVKETTKSC